jgi:hypothetical protein
MKTLAAQRQFSPTLLKMAGCLVLAGIGLNATAVEGFKLRQSPIGAFGGEMAAGVDNPGLFGTASLTHVDISKVVDGNGNGITLPAQTVPLAGAFRLNVAPGSIDFHQSQTQLNLVGGYLTESLYANGRLAFAVNVPVITMGRSFMGMQPLGTVSPIPVPGPIAAGAVVANNTVQARVAASSATQNVGVTGFGDTELSAVWVRHQDRLKVAAGVSLFVPTGAYDKNRGPNPGSGNFYTVRPGVAVTYALNPNSSGSTWDAGVTLAGRLSYGVNSTNKDTDYRSGKFVYAEVGAVKVSGNWAFGTNLLAIQQVSNDTSPLIGSTCLGTVDAAGCRYKTYGVGPFVSYKLPGKDAGFNLQYSQNFGGRNALVAKSLQLRFVKAW